MQTENLSAPTRRWADQGLSVEVLGRHQMFAAVRGDGPALLMIHGFPTSSHDYREMIARLSPDFRCIAPDMLGYGLSDKPIAFSYSLFQQSDAIEQLLHHLGVDRAHVVSHDVGTSVHAELLARQLEGHLSFEILTSSFLNGSLIKGMAKLTPIQKLLEAPANLGEAVVVCENIAPDFVPLLKGLMKRADSLSDEDCAVMEELLLYQDGNRRIPGVYSYVRERYLHQDRWLSALERTTSPVQFIWAQDDPVAVKEMGEALAERVPGAAYNRLPGVGHFVPIEAPDEVATLVRSFIAA